MPQYQTPGVYVEEVERGPKPIEGVSTSTAGFLGETERGPTEPRVVTSFAEFRRVYGGFTDSNLAYAVDGFFRNGGGRCYVARIVPSNWLDGPSADAALGSGSLADGADEEAEDVIDVTATGPGDWANNVAVKIEDATLGGDESFKATIGYWRSVTTEDEEPDWDTLEADNGDATVEEVYDNLSLDPKSSNYYESRINGVSNLVEFSPADGGDGRPANGTTTLSATVGENDSVDATDYDGQTTAGERTGLAAFTEIDEISIVCAPDENTHDLSGKLITHCANLKDRFAVLQADRSTTPGNLPPDGLTDSTYGAFYYPWLKIRDPETNLEKSVPPGGHVAGIYARSDTQHGVHKAPANEVVRGVQGLEFTLSKEDQAGLNPKGVNCIRSFPGRGIRVWGARTISSDPLWKYVNVRRLFLYLEESIDEGTQWVVFEGNNEETWARVRQSVKNFLTGVWEDGALMGSTPEEAFYVKCDRSTMTQDDIDNGRLICEIGVAPVKPAEFVIFRIGQWTGGAEG